MVQDLFAEGDSIDSYRLSVINALLMELGNLFPLRSAPIETGILFLTAMLGMQDKILTHL